VRLAALNLKGISEVDPGISRPETVISGISRFSLKSICSNFLHRCHLSV